MCSHIHLIFSYPTPSGNSEKLNWNVRYLTEVYVLRNTSKKCKVKVFLSRVCNGFAARQNGVTVLTLQGELCSHDVTCESFRRRNTGARGRTFLTPLSRQSILHGQLTVVIPHPSAANHWRAATVMRLCNLVRAAMQSASLQLLLEFLVVPVPAPVNRNNGQQQSISLTIFIKKTPKWILTNS